MTMEIFELAPSITNLISLAALVVLTAYVLYKLICERLVMKKIGSVKTAQLVRSVINWMGTIVTVVLLLVFASSLASRADSVVQHDLAELVTAMHNDVQQGFYDMADLRANEILSVAPENCYALNVKGLVAFYHQSYHEAVQYFTRALKAKLNDPGYTMNLADALIETGGYTRAIELYRSVEDVSPTWSYSLGRAYMHAGDYWLALTFLEAVPTAVDRGRARVLEAACLVGCASEELNSSSQEALLKKAREKLDAGLTQDSSYWNGVLTGELIDIHESHTRARALLQDLVSKAPLARSGDCCVLAPMPSTPR